MNVEALKVLEVGEAPFVPPLMSKNRSNVGVGDAVVDSQHEIGPHWRGDTAMHADLRGKDVSRVKPCDFQGISMAEMPAPHGNAVAVVTAM